MGMYDIINGEQVKCFGWYSHVTGPLIGNEKLDYHGGNLTAFESGEVIPYKRLFYNYSPNFMILDTNPKNKDNAFVIHVVKDKRLLLTIEMTKDGHNLYKDNGKSPDPNLDMYFTTNNQVIGYFGESGINIQSIADAHAYYDDITKLRQDINDATPTSQQQWKEYMKLVYGIGLLDKQSDEYKQRKAAIQANRIKYHNALQTEKPTVDALKVAFTIKWYLPESNAESILLGKWIDAGQLALKKASEKPDEYQKFCKDFRKAFPVLHDSMIEDYHKWYNSTAKERQDINSLIYKFAHSLT